MSRMTGIPGPFCGHRKIVKVSTRRQKAKVTIRYEEYEEAEPSLVTVLTLECGHEKVYRQGLQVPKKGAICKTCEGQQWKAFQALSKEERLARCAPKRAPTETGEDHE